MGLLIDGVWHDQGYDTKKTGGHFKRKESQFRNWLSADSDTPFPAASNRYHLYVSLACSWAHRALIFRELKQLTEHIDVSIVSPYMLSNGWELTQNFPGTTGDKLFGFEFAHQVYCKAQADYTGRVTVPILWDKKQDIIVSNESADIIRMFNSAFNDITGNHDDYYPKALRTEIDAVNDLVYNTINNGVYKCGFATTQEAYDEAIVPLFTSLDQLEQRLASKGPYLCGNTLTEADWRLFTTLIRFDAVYVGHFKCNLRTIAEYPHLRKYLKQLYNHPGIAGTVNFDHIKTHYYFSHTTINPTQIIPQGPDLSWFER